MSLLLQELTLADKEIFVDMAYDFFNGADDAFEKRSRECFYPLFADLLSGQYSAQGYLLFDDDLKQVVGYTAWCFTYSTEGARPVVWLEDLYVKPQYRSHKYGSQVLAALEERHPGARLRLETWPTNTGAQRLYERQGYKQSDLVQYVKDLDRE